jgi:type VI secretion system protein ImpL
MTQTVEAPKVFVWHTALLLALVVAVLVAVGAVAWWLWAGPQTVSRAALQDVLLKALVCWLLLSGVAIVIWRVVQHGIRTLVKRSHDLPSPEPAVLPGKRRPEVVEHLRNHYGLFWRHKVRLLLIVGETEQIEAIAPGLVAGKWLEGQGTVLLWGGSMAGTLPEEQATLLKKLHPRRPFDGIVWALTETQGDDVKAMSAGTRYLRDLSRALAWQAPLYLWQVCPYEWATPYDPAQPVGCLLPPKATVADLEAALQLLVAPLNEQGMAQMQVNMAHFFLFHLGRDLRVSGIAHWTQVLAPLLAEFARSTPLRGLQFSLARTDGAVPAAQHLLQLDGAWAAVLGDTQARGQRMGWHAGRVLYVASLATAGLLGCGVLLSFVGNRGLVAHVAKVVEQPAFSLSALGELTRELDRLEYRRLHGAPWYLGFGLSQNQALLDRLWPRYVQANNALLRDVAAQRLAQTLQALVAQPPGSASRSEMAREAYAPLKAYLMMAHPEKADPAFLAKALESVVPGLPGLWGFYVQQLPAHPQWRITADARLVAQARQVLLGELGQRNGEASLYQQVLERVGNHYPALELAQMVGDTDAWALFDVTASVPGVFTRQAWEGQVRAAIDEIAEARREEIDWVLSDQQGNIASELSPQALKARLTERYFQDFGDAWLGFLNSLRWRRAASLPEVIDQLTLMSDVRQSPLVALVNTVAYQGQTGTQGPALADSLMQSAQQLLGKQQAPAIDQQVAGLQGPLDDTFGPLLQLLGKSSGDTQLSLQAYLTRVTRVRLKLQQILNASDPQATTQALAQSVFQGHSIDLTDTRDYGSLIAASLGGQWSGLGQSLFVQPLNQAWEAVLQPSAAGLNRQWQRAIVRHWDSAFIGRYPLAATGSDISLPMLGQMIRSDTGRIDQFLQQQLGGVLRKEGNRWVADPRHSQGLRFNPAFLAAVNQLSHLADVLYTDGGMGLGFELQAKPVRDVVQTTFILNGERQQYYNQKESWQRFTWPGRSDHPGVSLSWTSVHTGERLLGDYAGTWGLIRLLEKAQVTALDDSDTRFRIVLKAPDGLPLTWHLRTELGAGPLALLTLRGFTLPQQIFLADSDAAQPYALNGSIE